MKRAGIVISRSAVQLAVVRWPMQQVEWSATRAIEASETIVTAFVDALDSLPPRVRRVAVALESDICQVRIIHDLPQLRRSQLRRAVHLNAFQWFLRSAPELVTDAMHLRGSTSVIAAAASAELVRTIRQELDREQKRLVRVVPAATAVAAIIGDGECQRRVGDLVETIEAKREQLVRRCRTRHPAQEPVGSGSDDAEFEAYRVAVAAVTTPGSLAFRPESPDSFASTARISAVAGAVGTLLWSGAFAATSMRLHAQRADAQERYAQLAPAVAAITKIQEQLHSTRQTIGILEQRRASRSRDLVLLDRLTQVLPPSVHLVSVRRGRDHAVQVEGLAPGDINIVALLQRMPGSTAPRLVGAVTREATADSRSRFTVDFTWQPEVP